MRAKARQHGNRLLGKVSARRTSAFRQDRLIEVTIEGAEGDRWKGTYDDIRQAALVLVERSGKRLTLEQARAHRRQAMGRWYRTLGSRSTPLRAQTGAP